MSLNEESKASNIANKKTLSEISNSNVSYETDNIDDYSEKKVGKDLDVSDLDDVF